MNVTVNGDAMNVPDGLSLRGLVEHLGLAGGPVAIEQNGEIVTRARHESTIVSEGDVLEVVHFVGGG
jgi:sulfur carrier protein